MDRAHVDILSMSKIQIGNTIHSGKEASDLRRKYVDKAFKYLSQLYVDNIDRFEFPEGITSRLIKVEYLYEKEFGSNYNYKFLSSAWIIFNHQKFYLYFEMGTRSYLQIRFGLPSYAKRSKNKRGIWDIGYSDINKKLMNHILLISAELLEEYKNE